MKQMTRELQQKLQSAIPRIVENVTGTSATDRKFVFYKDSVYSHKNISDILTEEADRTVTEQIAIKVLAVTHDNLKDIKPELIVATVPVADGWLAAFYHEKEKAFAINVISDEDLESFPS